MAHFQYDLHLELIRESITYNRETLSTWLSFLVAGTCLFGHAQLILRFKHYRQPVILLGPWNRKGGDLHPWDVH